MSDGNDDPTPPGWLARSAVPLYFPQFRKVGTLAHLAHVGRGPRYVLVGGTAWYDPTDIRAWLEENKQYGPTRLAGRATVPKRQGAVGLKKRGRPTKLEQMKRRSGADAALVDR